MANTWAVYLRDLRRLGKVPLAWVIIFGALITPSLYAWFNIVAFWNPFDNTKNLSIAVVNQDAGADSDLTGELNVGDQLVDQLRDNTDLGWQFLDYEAAMASLKSGESFAAFVINESFSEDLLSLTTGTFTQPKIEYYVNEKLNGVAPEITDTGATTIQTQMTDAFTQQVASAAATAIQSGGGTVDQRLTDTQNSVITKLNTAGTQIAETRVHLAALETGIGASREELTSADQTLAGMQTSLTDLQTVVNDAATLANQAQTKLIELATTVTTAYANSAASIANAAAEADAAVTHLTQGIDTAQARIDAQITALEESAGVIAQIRTFVDGSSLPNKQELLDKLDALDTAITAAENKLDATSAALGTASTDLNTAATAAENAAKSAAAAARTLSTTIAEQLPALQRPMAELSAATHRLSAALDSQRVILGEARTLISDLNTQLGSTLGALDSLEGNLAALQNDMRTATTDVQALSGAAAWKQIASLTSLNPEQIASFMATPVLVQQHTLFETKSYGSLMGSLFINLSLWIGSFVLVVIMKLEVDREGIPNLTERQRYMGRWLLFATIAVLQAVVLSIGNLIIGVQHVNAAAFVLTPVLIGLCYLSIIYALSVTFGYIGKGLCVVFVIMQIPGASGIYPIELMPQFFQTLYPFFPFTYGIDAMREVVSGFAGFAYLRAIAMLLVFAALAFFLGLVLRNSVSNLTRLFTQEVGSTGLFATETGMLSQRGYRLNHLLRALNNRERYTSRLAKRALPFARSYRKVRGALIAVGLLGIVLIMTLGVLLPEQKTTFVGLWIVWLLLIFALLIALEYMRYSLRLSTEVSEMPEAELQRNVEEIEAQR